MRTYSQYCPMAHALDLLGDRWTLLIVRDLLAGTKHFNGLERGLPGISRALLSNRLQMLQAAGIVEKQLNTSGPNTTEYHLSEAGKALKTMVTELIEWGAMWAFDDPRPDELNPTLLMWWMHDRIQTEHLPQERVVVEFNFYGESRGTYWLLLTYNGSSVCLKPPGLDIDVIVRSDIAVFYKLWLGRINYSEAIDVHGVEVDGLPELTVSLPNWFAWSLTAPAIQAAQAKHHVQPKFEQNT